MNHPRIDIESHTETKNHARLTSFKNVFSRLAWVSALLFVASFGYGWSQRQIQSAQPGEFLLIPTEKLDFGTRYSPAVFDWEVPITNSGAHSVTIEEIKVSCGCTSVSPSSFSIHSGETQLVKFTIKPPRNLTKYGEKFALHFELRVVNNLSGIRNVRELTGYFKQAIDVSIPAIAYDGMKQIISGESVIPTELDITCLLENASLRVTCPPEVGSLERLSLEKSNPSRFLFTPATTLPPGVHENVLLLESLNNQQQSITSQHLPVRVSVVGLAFLFPSVLELGPLKPGTTGQGELYLSSATGKPFRVELPKDDNFEISCETCGEFSEIHEIKVRTSHVLMGRQTYPIAFTLKDAGENREKILARVAYSGVLAVTEEVRKND